MFIKNDVLTGIGSTSGTFQCYFSGLLDRDVWFFDISHNNNNDSGRKFKKVEVSDQDDETVMNGEFLSFLLEDQDETLCLFIGGYDDLGEISYSMEMIIVTNNNNIRNSELNISNPKCGRTKFYLKPYSDLFEVFKRAPIQSTLIQSMEKKYYRLLLDVEQELYYLDVIFDDFYYYCKLFPHYFTNRFSDIDIVNHNA